ncbi:hypothetical protein [Cellulosimicrobium cellulans]|uniref:hypothetical protein n=1 Tax=Cellulosimicrobium cellulans TaxID=1710 RepID=UPI00130DCF63|nr:hypothetical protein [Cellulosimicrobium cellulans]
MSLAVVFLPDTALLVPGAAGRADPASGLRDAAAAALADLADPEATGGRVLVVAPARRDRFLPHPVAPGLGAAGLDLPGAAPAGDGAVLADTPASVALMLLRAAGVSAPVDVLEIDRAAADAPATAAVAAPGPLRAVVVVGSLSARHGPDAPLADDPRAPGADDALLAALAGGPVALARALDDLGADRARDLAVSGWAPWRAALALLAAHLGPEPARAGSATPYAEVVAGAQHVVAAWRPDPARPADPASPGHPAPHHPEEPR